VSISRKRPNAKGGRIDHDRVIAATEEQIREWKRQDGYEDFEFNAPVRAIPAVNVREIREQVGLTQEQFAATFRLSLRNIQEWEQGRKQPSEAARVLLFAISREPSALKRALRSA
jgi:putative transcriptional regulator